MADSNPNPFYFGYYPGERPVYRGGGGAPTGPLFDLPAGMDLLGGINQLEYQLSKVVDTVNLPRWLKERYIKDLTGKLVIGVTPDKKIDMEEFERRGTEALEDMPGVAVKLSINPVDWANDPGGMVKKTLQTWASGVFDPDDFDRRARGKLWAKMLSDDKPDNTPSSGSFIDDTVRGWEVKSSNAAIAEMEKAVMRFSNGRGTTPGVGDDIKTIRKDVQLMGRGKNPDDYTPTLLSLDDPMYTAVKQSILDFELHSTNVLKRESSYDTFVKNSLYAMDEDIKSQVFLAEAMQTLDFGNRRTWDADFAASVDGLMKNKVRAMDWDGASGTYHWESANYEESIKNLYRRNGITDDATLNRYVDHVQGLHSQAELARYFDNLEKHIGAASANLDQLLLSDNPLKSIDAQVNMLGFQKTLGHVGQTDINSYMTTLDSSLRAAYSADGVTRTQQQLDDLVNKKTSGIKSSLENVKSYSPDQIEHLISKLPLDQQKKVRSDMQRHLESRRGLIGARQELNNILGGFDVNQIKNMSASERAKLKKKLKTQLDGVTKVGLVGESITGGDVPLWGHSAQRKYLRNVNNSWFKYDEHEKALGGLTSKGNVLFSLIPRLEEERAQHEWDEFFSNIEKDGFLMGMMNTYGWNRLKKKYAYLTPSYYVEKILKSVNNFGLKIEEAYDVYDGVVENGVLRAVGPSSQYLFAFGGKKDELTGKRIGGYKFGYLGSTEAQLVENEHGIKEWIYEEAVSSWIFGNKFTVAFDLPAGARKATLNGGAHFNFLTNEKFKSQLKDLRAQNLFNADSFKDLLMAGSEADFLQRLGTAGFKIHGDAAAALYKDFTGYKRWLTKQSVKLGGNPNDANFAYAIFMGVHNYDLKQDHWGVSSVVGITQRYAGPLQKVYKHLNALQTRLFETTAGRVLNVAVNYKTLLAQKIARGSLKIAIEKFVTKLLSWFGQAAASETVVGSFLIKAIEPAIRYVVKKFIDAGAAVFKAVTHGDFSAIFVEIGAAMNAAVKMVIGALAIPVVLMVGCMIVIIQVIGGFSPTNPSVMGGGEYTYGGPPGGGTHSASDCPEPTIPATSCIFKDGARVSTGSYTSSNETGHGSNSYWDALVNWGYVDDPCEFNIPTASSGTPARGSLVSSNVCNGIDPARSYYGYASDNVSNSCWTVYLPNIADNWSVGNVGSANFGGLAVATGYDSFGNEVYKMTLLHLAVGSVVTGNLAPGAKVAETAEWGNNTHVHVELAEWTGSAWQGIRPESVICR